MDTRQEIQKCINICQQSAGELRKLAQTESSQTCKELLLDAAHHLDVALAECNYSLNSIS